VHHWIAPTPFQYAAVALSPLVQRPRPAPALLLVPWLCVRLWSAGDTQRSLWKGDASGSYHPARTTIARYAAAHARDTLFVVATRRAAAELARRELPLDPELAGIPGVRKFENPYANH
jgi:hypothetical protein